MERYRKERGAGFVSYTLLAGVLALICIPGAHMMRGRVQETACVTGGHLLARNANHVQEEKRIYFDPAEQLCSAVAVGTGAGFTWVFAGSMFNNDFF